MNGKKIVKTLGAVSLSTFMALTSMNFVIPMNVSASELNLSDFTAIGAVKSVTADGNTVEISYVTGEKAKITFLEDNIFRFNMETDSSKKFLDVAEPNKKDHTATIVQQKDDSDEYSHPDAVVTDGDVIVIGTANGTARLYIDKATSMMMLMNGDQVVWEETKPLMYKSGKTVQTLKENTDEYFYGGGTQNGRFSHKGETLDISNTNNWVNNGVASPNPFYWSTKGYGVVRNTWKPGSYDFGDSVSGQVQTVHNETRFDAYYFVDDQANDILKDYYKVTGAPALLPEYAFYLGHLNCYNRDAWVANSNGKWELEDGNRYNETNREGALLAGETLETLNGTNADDYKFSARAVVDGHKDQDFPLGWFVPNDGYGCGYGRTGNLEQNIENLGDFTEYAEANGIKTGLWTQSDLTPNFAVIPDLQRDFVSEVVNGGIRSLKTDVAWVGDGYSFALNGVKFASDTIVNKVNERPNIVTLDGWAGTQRYGGIWTGDQTGGNWEYIRFHIPTYIGQSLSGNPNIGSDMDGIFGGSSVVQTRDYQWKSFTPLMLDMDGWGDYPKKPYAFGEDNSSINRMYLKMKAEMMPYIYTMAHEATGLDGTSGKPMIRAMMLDYNDAYTAGTATQYQYMWGDNLLVAPIYQDTASDENGNDIRNNIYLPDENQVWIDYFTGEQYQGGKVLNNFEAPIWKLPLFVKNGAIIPMYEENNNAQAVSATNENGLDKTKRVVVFYPSGSTDFDLFEDDGTYAENNADNTEINYGSSTNTHITSVVDGDQATLTIEPTTGSYKGYDANRTTTMVVNVSKEPTALEASLGGTSTALEKVSSQEEFDQAEGNVYFYNETPNLNKYATEGSDFADVEITTTPKLYVKFAKTNVAENETKLVVKGFANEGVVIKTEQADLEVPTGLTYDDEHTTFTAAAITWDETTGAQTYEVSVDGIVNTAGTEAAFVKDELESDTEYTFAVRAVYETGYSKWSEPITVKTKLDPYRNVIPEFSISSKDNSSSLDSLKDRDFSGAFYSKFDNNNPEVAKREKTFVFDFQEVYAMDKFEIYPTQGGDVYTQHQPEEVSILASYDGVNYETVIDHQKIEGTDTIDVKTLNLNGKRMRYLKFIVHQPYNTWIALSELMPYKLDKSTSNPSGDYNSDGVTDSNDITFLTNYNGLSKVDADFAYVADKGADVNMNGVIDAYDIAFVGSMMNGGINETRTNASGRFSLTPSATEIKAGEEFTVTVDGIGMKNVNAFGISLPIDGSKFEYVGTETGAAVYGMESFIKYRVHTDSTTDLYANFTNLGDADKLTGNKQLLVFTFKAKEDFTWDTKASYGMLVGSSLNVVDAFAASDDMPSMEDDVTSLPLSDIEVRGEDESVLQSGMGVDKLIDGYIGDDSVRFEFQWGNSADDIDARLPYEITYSFKEPTTIKNLLVYLRNDDGALNSGALKDFELYKADKDGNKLELVGKYSATQETTENGVYSADLGNDVYEGLVLKALTSQGGMEYKLNIDETEFVIDVPASEIAVDVDRYSEIPVGSLVEFTANVLPENASNKYYTVESSNPDVVAIDTFVSGDDISYQLRGVKEGSATIIVTSVKNPSVKNIFTVNVADKVDTYYLEELIAQADAMDIAMYNVDTQKALLNVINDAKLVLDTATTKDEVNKACIDLRIAMMNANANIEYAKASQRIENGNLTAISATSDSDGNAVEYAIDDDMDTIWHSAYGEEDTLPQNVVIQLGEEPVNLKQIDYLARQDSKNGHITKYQVEVSITGTEDEDFKVIKVGTFANNGESLVNPSEFKHIIFGETAAKYVRFTALETLGGTNNKYASIAELRFFQTEDKEIENVSFNKELPVDTETGVEYLTVPQGTTLHFNLFLDGNMVDNQKVTGINWTSSDETIASVDQNGVINALQPGTSTITATIQLNSRSIPLTKSFELRVNGVDKASLEAQIAIAEAMSDKADAVKTEALKDNFYAAIEHAKAALIKDGMSEADIMAEVVALSNAMDLLDSDEAFALLQQKADRAALVNKDFYEKDDEAFAAFDEALNNAQTILADPVHHADEVIRAIAALDDAKDTLVEIELADLQKAIEKYDAMDLSGYAKDAQMEAFLTELDAAKALLEKPESQQNVFDQIEALIQAADALNVKATTSALDVLKEIKAALDKVDMSKYTEETQALIKAYQDSVNAALANAELTQEEADALLNAYTAISKIIANPDAEEQNGGSTVVPGKPGLPETDGQAPTINGGDPLASTGQQANNGLNGALLVSCLAAGALLLVKRKDESSADSE